MAKKSWVPQVVKMGFASYEAYLESDLWLEIRCRVLNRDACTCQCCGKRAEQVHHFKYTQAVMAGKRDDCLVSICTACHHRSHFNDKGNKRKARQANRHVFNAMATFRSPQRDAVEKAMNYKPRKDSSDSWKQIKQARKGQRILRQIASEKKVWQAIDSRQGASALPQ